MNRRQNTIWQAQEQETRTQTDFFFYTKSERHKKQEQEYYRPITINCSKGHAPLANKSEKQT